MTNLPHRKAKNREACSMILFVRAITVAGLLLLVFADSAPTIAQPTSQPLNIHMALSRSSALLGEPVWVEVIVANSTSKPILLDWGAACPDFGSKAIEIHVPTATLGSGEPTPCGSPGGNCVMPGPVTLAPGESETRRYVLSGDFHITRPGRYRVTAQKVFAYSFATAKQDINLPSSRATQTVDFEGLLRSNKQIQSASSPLNRPSRQKRLAPSPRLHSKCFRALPKKHIWQLSAPGVKPLKGHKEPPRNIATRFMKG